jgi:hypothetical protein
MAAFQLDAPSQQSPMDHDHCVACWAKFSDSIPGTLHEGYMTGVDHPRGLRLDWVCDDCFSKLKEELQWTTGSARSGN